MPLPERIDRYEVLDRIGRGGMGVVYRARDPKLGRIVAIKVLMVPENQRFLREAQMAGTLKHRNIVTVHDYGEVEGRPYMVLEYVDGQTIAHYLAQQVPIPLARKLEWLHDLSLALDYAHQHDIVHRDVKPANLMIDRQGVLKILDFGIARATASELTASGAILGTPSYMAPEQISAGVVDRRADVFAVGVTAYELFSGRRAFPGDTMVRVAMAILTEQPPPLTELCPLLDPELERIVVRAIEKDPARRYATLALMAADLARVIHRLNAAARLPHDVEETVAYPAPEAPAAAGAMYPSVSLPDHAPVADHPWLPAQPSVVSDTRRRTIVRAAASLVLLSAVVASASMAWRAGRAAPAPAETARSIGLSRDSAPPLVPPPPAPPPSSPAAAVTPTRSNEHTPAKEGSKVRPGTNSSAPRGTDRGSTTDADSTEKIRLACDGGNLAECVALGQFLESGTHVTRNANRAIDLYQRACDGNLGQGCNNLALMYERGESVPKNEARATLLFQQACERGYPAGCTNWGLVFLRGVSVPKDDPRAVALFQRACDQGAGSGCFNLGRAQEFGQGTPLDPAKAALSQQRGCATGNVGSCTSLGWQYFRGVGVEKDETRAVALFVPACDTGYAVACNNLGFAYAQGRGVVKDESRAAKLYQSACDKNNALACTNLGLMYQRGAVVPRDDARATALFQRACDGNNPAGCVNVGAAYEFGRGVSKDEARAAGLYQRVCDAGNSNGCTRLAVMYEQGRGVAKDPARSATLYQRGKELIGRDSPAPAAAPTPAPTATPASPGAPPPQRTTLESSGQRTATVQKALLKIKDVKPIYPVAARIARVQGMVVVEVTIGRDGRVTQTRIAESIPLLDGAAEDAVKQWQYAPPPDGLPVIVRVPVNFSLTDGTNR